MVRIAEGALTNSVHRVLPDATHAMLTENHDAAVQSSRAIRDVVNSIRAGAPITGAAG